MIKRLNQLSKSQSTIYVMAFCVIAGAGALFTAFLIGWLVIELITQYPSPDPITYGTRLYVESENIQPARGDLQ